MLNFILKNQDVDIRLDLEKQKTRLVFFCALFGTHVTSVSRQREFFQILFEFFGNLLFFPSKFGFKVAYFLQGEFF